MPQLAQLALVYQSQWFWLLLTLGAIYFIAGRGIVPKVEATVDARDAQIAKDLAEAERLRAEADAAEEGWRAKINAVHADAAAQAAEAKAKATADAENIATGIRARAQQESEEIKERANKDIESARDQAIGQIHNEAVNLATNIAEKILHRSLNADDQRDLLARSLEQLQTIGRN